MKELFRPLHKKHVETLRRDNPDEFPPDTEFLIPNVALPNKPWCVVAHSVRTRKTWLIAVDGYGQGKRMMNPNQKTPFTVHVVVGTEVGMEK